MEAFHARIMIGTSSFWFAHHLLIGDCLPSLQYQRLEYSFLTLVCGDLTRRRSTANTDSVSHIVFYKKQFMYYFLQRIRHGLGPNVAILPRFIIPEGINCGGAQGNLQSPSRYVFSTWKKYRLPLDKIAVGALLEGPVTMSRSWSGR